MTKLALLRRPLIASASVLALASTLLTASPAQAEEADVGVPRPPMLQAQVVTDYVPLGEAAVVHVWVVDASDNLVPLNPGEIALAGSVDMGPWSMRSLDEFFVEISVWGTTAGTVGFEIKHQDQTVVTAWAAVTFMGGADPGLTLSDTRVGIQHQCYGDTIFPEFKAYLTAPGASIDDITWRWDMVVYPVVGGDIPEDTATVDVVEVVPMPTPVEPIVLIDGWYPAGEDQYTAYFVAYERGDYYLEVTAGGQTYGATIYVEEGMPICRPPIALSVEQAPVDKVKLPDSASIVIRATDEYGQPANYADGQIIVLAPDGASVTYVGSPGEGLYEYEVTATRAGTYDIDFGTADFSGIYVPVTFASASTNPLTEILVQIIGLILDLLKQLVSLLAIGYA
jgi:hypothetical protein